MVVASCGKMAKAEATPTPCLSTVVSNLMILREAIEAKALHLGQIVQPSVLIQLGIFAG
jgi:hypothetical protein